MPIRNALQAQRAITQQAKSNTEKWLDIIDHKIEFCIENQRTKLLIHGSSPLARLFLDQAVCSEVIRALKQLGYHVTYYGGSYIHSKFLLIDWSLTQKTKPSNELAEREAINQQLIELQKSLKNDKIL